jgi:KEOPS complex subunit Pcc1
MLGCAEFVFETLEPDAIYRALEPELEDELHRSNVEMRSCDGSLVLLVRGDDVGSLRAALNTWIRLVKIAFEMVNI